MATKLDAILEINPTAKFMIKGDNPVEWLEGTSPISDSDIDAKVTEITTRDAHKEPREKAYADVKEQLDQLYHDMTADKLDATGEWHKAIKVVKDANPKA